MLRRFRLHYRNAAVYTNISLFDCKTETRNLFNLTLLLYLKMSHLINQDQNYGHSPGTSFGDGGFRSSITSLGLGGLRLCLLLNSSLFLLSSLSSSTGPAGGFSDEASGSPPSSSEVEDDEDDEDDDEDEDVAASLASCSMSSATALSSSPSLSSSSELSSYSEKSSLSAEELALDDAELPASAGVGATHR